MAVTSFDDVMQEWRMIDSMSIGSTDFTDGSARMCASVNKSVEIQAVDRFSPIANDSVDSLRFVVGALVRLSSLSIRSLTPNVAAVHGSESR